MTSRSTARKPIAPQALRVERQPRVRRHDVVIPEQPQIGEQQDRIQPRIRRDHERRERAPRRSAPPAASCRIRGFECRCAAPPLPRRSHWRRRTRARRCVEERRRGTEPSAGQHCARSVLSTRAMKRRESPRRTRRIRGRLRRERATKPDIGITISAAWCANYALDEQRDRASLCDHRDPHSRHRRS